MSRAVLDSSAILALVHGEPGGDVVDETLGDAVVSAVNVAEVATRLSDGGMPSDQIRATIDDLRVDVAAFHAEDALAVGEMRPPTRHAGLSLGDRACLALARSTGLPALTADRQWAQLDIGVEIRLIR